MRVLVTGANGFVGRHAVERLVAAGHEVLGMTLEGTAPSGARALRADVRDHHVVLRHLESERPDAILHLAAVAFVPAAQRDPRGAFEINAAGTLSLLTAVAEAAPEARVVMVSSAEVYGRVSSGSDEAEDEELRLDESRRLEPATLYGASKAAAEHLCRAYAELGLDVVVLRPFNHIGPGQEESYVVASFARQVARLERASGTLRHGNLEAVRDFLDVRDVVRGYQVALEAPVGRLRAGRPYNLCSGRGTSIQTLVDGLVARARRPIATEVDPERLRPVDVKRFVGDPERFRRATGFEPEIPLERTLDDVLAEARALAG